MLLYVMENIDFIDDFLKKKIPGIRLIKPEATYMVWLDFRGLKMTTDEIKDLLMNKAHLGLVDGRMFGPGGDGFQRMNVASPRSMIIEAMERLEKAVNKRI
jgi:cystathionine beta-lyase